MIPTEDTIGARVNVPTAFRAILNEPAVIGNPATCAVETTEMPEDITPVFALKAVLVERDKPVLAGIVAVLPVCAPAPVHAIVEVAPNAITVSVTPDAHD